jgi:nucleotide-binding universal stress UspA family protein
MRCNKGAAFTTGFYYSRGNHMFKHILLATDGSAASEHAAQLAVGLARTHGAKLTVCG